MKRIDRETVQRILDSADIVEVVSDFVSLKKRGANYIGLCPFHNERTPSFSVSKAKGIYKCFSCGKGGSAINFIIEHEQMTFNEALRYLAKKYHIEIKEHEMTEQEQQRASERESMIAVNEFALKHFSSNLKDTADGRHIGLAYFRERGINDLMIERFKLGYAIDRPDVLYKAALEAGFDKRYLLETGLCQRSEQHDFIYDKFRGRVIYPIFSVSGRVVAFGARTLRNDKNVAKYMNSPQSLIYNKSLEIYGLYQAKSEIVKRNKCIMVEGYMDVISMHQVGVCNVVASSGTSLTEGQIRLIHRFTENVTLIYDSDAAGIKASLRGIDLLLAEGMNIKVVLLPDGDDPDSFAQSHTSEEVEKYIAANETDFIRFKTSILLKDANDDPIARARVVNDILRSIAVIPDMIVRTVYIKECSRMLGIEEQTLMLQLQKLLSPGNSSNNQNSSGKQPERPVKPEEPGKSTPQVSEKMRKYEEEVIKYIVKYGMANMAVAEGEEPIKVLEYIWAELDNDGLSFTVPAYDLIYREAIAISQEHWPKDIELFTKKLTDEYNTSMEKGREDIRLNARDLADIEARERVLSESCLEKYNTSMDDFCVSYIENILISHPNDEIRNTATDLACERYTLSKVHTRYTHVETERERLHELVPRAVLELKLGILNQRIDNLYEEIKRHCNDPSIIELLQEQKQLYEMRSAFSKYLGERIVTPK